MWRCADASSTLTVSGWGGVLTSGVSWRRGGRVPLLCDQPQSASVTAACVAPAKAPGSRRSPTVSAR